MESDAISRRQMLKGWSRAVPCSALTLAGIRRESGIAGEPVV